MPVPPHVHGTCATMHSLATRVGLFLFDETLTAPHLQFLVASSMVIPFKFRMPPRFSPNLAHGESATP